MVLHLLFVKFTGSILMRGGLGVVSICLCFFDASANEVPSVMILHLSSILQYFVIEQLLSLSLSRSLSLARR